MNAVGVLRVWLGIVEDVELLQPNNFGNIGSNEMKRGLDFRLSQSLTSMT